MKKLSNGWLATIIIVVAIILDQVTKIWVKTHFYYGEQVDVTSWFKIFFIENNGMAFGMEFFDKFLLTGFRIVATTLVAVYIARVIRRGISWGYLTCLTLILTGAAGNIIDCVFYGLIFDSPAPPQVAQLVPFGQGYGEWFRGRVVDMFYFPFFEWTWPDWVPFVGGSQGLFFSYIFNFADACISTGVIALLLFYRQTLAVELGDKPTPTDSKTTPSDQASETSIEG